MWRWLRPVSGRWAQRALRGRRAEQLAVDYLAAHGYAIVERNVRVPVGEIDVVAREGQTLCFIEVRSTSSEQWGGPLASITDRKRQHLIRAAQWYLRYSSVRATETRFDVVAISWRDPEPPTIEVVKGAFTADGARDA
ncbi:MAG: YraN family protein [Rhodospirillales bacterium RIFCSPLOWO2_01_FULL_65_14]|nr:MAG: YraN family protein [Rhodospirillales bacterium RIFCSPLOWO2_01_FULL_65_14]